MTNSVRAHLPTMQHIIIAGAGLSGLSAAYELARRGHRVTVIEARTRPGGRVFTWREPFADGLHVETGGELIGDGYKRFLAYAQEFGIAYEEVPSAIATGGSMTALQRGISTAVFMRGKLYAAGASLAPHPYNLPENEANLLPPELLAKHLRELAQTLQKDPTQLAALDKISLAEALRQRGASAAAVRLMNISLNYNDIETVSVGGVLWEARRRSGSGTKAMRLREGNDQVPHALARAAASKGASFIYGAQVTRIEHQPANPSNGVRVAYRAPDGQTVTVNGDKFISTLPFGVLREVTFAPALPTAKARGIRELAYTRITKTYLQARRAAWDAAGLGAALWTDTPAERIFAAAGKPGDTRGIFKLWTDGAGTVLTDKMDDAARIVWGRQQLATVLPALRDDIEGGATIAWAKDPLARGSYAHFAVGQLTALQPHLATPVGPLHFAGEHTAERAPGMEGALESAARVVAEIERNGS